jgi:hypothetical protein
MPAKCVKNLGGRFRNPLAGCDDHLEGVLVAVPACPGRDMREARFARVEAKRMANDERGALCLDLPLWCAVRVSNGVQNGVRHLVAKSRKLCVRDCPSVSTSAQRCASFWSCSSRRRRLGRYPREFAAWCRRAGHAAGPVWPLTLTLASGAVVVCPSSSAAVCAGLIVSIPELRLSPLAAECGLELHPEKT